MSSRSTSLPIVLERLAMAGFVVAGFISPIAPALKNLALGIAVLAYLIKNVMIGRWSLPHTTANLPLALWFFAGVLSMRHSVDLLASLRGLEKIIVWAATILVTADVVSTDRRRMALLIAVIIGGAVVSVDGLIQVVRGIDLLRGIIPGNAPGGLPRLTATFHHANDFAVYAVPILPVCVALALVATRKRTRWAMWGAILLLSLALVFTYSRPGALAIVITLCAFCMLRCAWNILGVLGIAAGLSVFILPAPIRAWVMSQPSWIDALAQPQRLEIWQAALRMMTTHPLIGVGINTFVLNYPRYKLPTDHIPSAYAHNHYLHMAAEIGVVGVAAFCFLLVRTYAAWRRVIARSDQRRRLIVTGLLCGLIGFLATGLLESALYSAHSNLCFWLWLGMLHGADRKETVTDVPAHLA